MTNEKTPKVVALLVACAVVAFVLITFTYSFNAEYGTTTGSRADGALDALWGGLVALLVIAALAASAFFVGRRVGWVRWVAVAALVVSVGGVAIAGAQAAVVKYDRLPKTPFCEGQVRDAEAFADLEHPGPFGGGWYGVTGCGAHLMNVTFAEAAAHYRDELRADGWEIIRDDDSELSARRDGLVFVLTDDCGLNVDITLASAVGAPGRCEIAGP